MNKDVVRDAWQDAISAASQADLPGETGYAVADAPVRPIFPR